MNLGGATIFEEYNSDVTHVIANQVNEKQCKSYIDQNPEVNILSLEWLIESCRESQLADCRTHCVFKNALNSVKTPKKRARTEKPTTSSEANINSDINDCLSQYMRDDTRIIRPPPPPPLFEEKNPVKMRDLSDNDRTISSQNTLNVGKTLSYSSSSDSEKYVHKNKIEGLFSNKRFRIWGFDESEVKDLEKVLLAKGADIIDNPIHYADYTLYPATIPEAIKENNSCTVYWMVSIYFLINKNNSQNISFVKKKHPFASF